MKKKVFRERYNMVNGNGEIIEEGLTIEDIKDMMPPEEDMFPGAKKIKVEAFKGEIKDYTEKPKRRGRPKKSEGKKNVK